MDDDVFFLFRLSGDSGVCADLCGGLSRIVSVYPPHDDVHAGFGDAGAAGLAALAVISAGAVIVLKKKER